MKQICALVVGLFGVLYSLVFSSSALGQEEIRPNVPKYASAEESRKVFDETVRPVLTKHCKACHNAKTKEGDLDLTMLEPDMMASTSAGRWAMLKKLVANKEMPPEGRPKLDDAQIKTVTEWIAGEMKRSGKNFATRAEFANGNKVPHDKLFDPKFKAKFDSPGSLRRLSPEIYAAEFAKSPGVGQPFTSEGGFAFKDMGAPKLDEPTTSLLIRNAMQLASNQTNVKIEDGKAKLIGMAAREFGPLIDESQQPTDAEIAAAIGHQFKHVLLRQPTKEESERFAKLMQKNIKDAGRVIGTRTTLAAVYLLPEAVYRWELGNGQVDGDGKVRLSPREIAYAISYSLTDRRPDSNLLADAEKGKLATREGVESAVMRILNDPKGTKPRIARFFREYFGYEKAKEIFQDDKANPDHEPKTLIDDTDRLIEYILEKDQNVFVELLTTNKAFVGIKVAADLKAKRAALIAQFEAGKKKEPAKYKDKKLQLPGKSVYAAYNLDDFPDSQPVDLPKDQRAGVLTQPSWLAANSKTDENHAIFRGKWVREKLLGGVVPDVPITVDAQLPNAPHHTLRERMKVTEQAYCWKCHVLMNPVGMPFETFDFLGRFRKAEPVLDVEATEKNVDNKGKRLGKVQKPIPVDASGKINEVGDPSLESDVKNAVEMLHKIGKSERAEQVFIRHAFRYFMGRNENLGDGPSLQYAQRRYRESGGSMKALVAAILTSDSFLYRVPSANGQ